MSHDGFMNLLAFIAVGTPAAVMVAAGIVVTIRSFLEDNPGRQRNKEDS